MSAHYKQPILLIEFEEQKSFSLEVRSNALCQCLKDLKDY
jgi:ERCC4-type nuclease